MLFKGISGLGGLFMILGLRKVNKFEMKGGTKNRFSPLYARPFCPFFAGARSILPIIFFVGPLFYFLIWAMRSWCLHIIFISCHPARYTYLLFRSCCSLIAALTLLSANWYSLLDFYFSLVNARCDSYFTLFATSLSPLAAYRLLLFVAARCWFSLLAGLYSLHAAHCHTYMRSRQKKKGRPTCQLKILKNSKTKKSTQCRQRKKKVSFNKKKSIFL